MEDNMEKLTSDSSSVIEDSTPDYLTAIKKLKETTVDRTKYEELRAENKRLINEVLNGTQVEKEVEKAKPSIQELREKLFNTGNIFYALSYKEYHEHAEQDKKMFPVWVLFSPSTKIDENPHLLEKVKDNLDQLLLDKELAKKYHHLLTMYSDNLAEPKYYKVPDEFSPDFDCYICLTNLIQSRFPVFHLGINLVIANKKVSNEIHYLPYVYWTEEFLKQY